MFELPPEFLVKFSFVLFLKLLFQPLAEPFPNDRPLVPLAAVPRAEKKCSFCATFRVVDGAAGRPLAEKLSRLGVIGSLPVEKRAF